MSDLPERLEESVRYVRRLLEEAARGELAGYVEGIHPSDVADVLEHLEEDERLRVLELLPADTASRALAEMEEVERPAQLLVRLEPERIAQLVEELPDDDAADLIGELEPPDQARVLGSLEDAAEIRELLHYPEDTAGGLMTRDLLSVSSTSTATEAIEAIRARGTAVEDFYNIFVVDPDGRLRGIVTLQRLVLAAPHTRIEELVEEPPATVRVEVDQEEVGRALSRYNLAAIAVVDPRGRLVGRITFDDVIDVIEAETTEDILRFASVSEEEEVRGTTREAVRSRLPWLLFNLLSISLAASVVTLFEDTIQQALVLATAMPVIAALGGNAGTQALAVTIRRIALSEETLPERWSVVGKELLVGLFNGFVVGAVVAVAGILLCALRDTCGGGQDAGLLFGAVAMVAVWGNLLVASFAGAFFPILLESIGVDPAVASSIFVTTFTDLFGFFLLLGLASLVLL